MRRLGLTLIVTAIAGAALGCAPDNGKNDPGRSARSSSITPAAMQQPSAPVPVPAVKDDRPVIVCFGDSITAGLGLDFDSTYPADMQRDLDMAGFGYRVVNMGVSGDTTKDGLNRVPRVLALKPAWVVVEFGGNDGLRGLPIADTQQNLATMVNQLRRGGAKVLLAGISLPAQYGTDYITHFNAIFPAVARQTQVPLYPFLYKDVFGVAGAIQDDGIHPTVQGAAQVAKNIESALLPLLRK